MPSTNKAVGAYTSSVSVEFTGKPITIVSTNPRCSLDINSQTNLTTVEFVNDTTDVTITTNVGGITGTVTEDGFLCPFNGVGVKTGGTYKTTKPITLTAGVGTVQVSGE